MIRHLQPLMTQSGWRVVAFSRQTRKSEDASVEWRWIDALSNPHPSPLPKGEGTFISHRKSIRDNEQLEYKAKLTEKAELARSQ